MSLGEIKALGARLAELCQKYGIAELAVFGSVPQGDAGPDSDVDLLCVRVPGNDLGMAYFDLQETWSVSSATRWTWWRRTACTG